MTSIQHIFTNSSHLPFCHIQKAEYIHHQLNAGMHYNCLGGKRIKQAPSFIRFKIGQGWRLLYRQYGQELQPDCLIPRHNFETTIKRRSS